MHSKTLNSLKTPINKVLNALKILKNALKEQTFLIMQYYQNLMISIIELMKNVLY